MNDLFQFGNGFPKWGKAESPRRRPRVGAGRPRAGIGAGVAAALVRGALLAAAAGLLVAPGWAQRSSAPAPAAPSGFAGSAAHPAPGGDAAPAGSSANKAAAEVKTASATDPAYTLGPGDVVAIDVWQEPEVSRTLPVQPDGRLSLPLAGQMHVAGLTTMQLQALITERLKKYIDHPSVTVMLQQAVSRRFNIVGMVVKPGSFTLTQPTTVLDAIAEAGGLRDFAHPKKIYVIRKRASDGVEIRFNFNYDQVSRGLDMQQNIRLRPNDTVVVP